MAEEFAAADQSAIKTGVAIHAGRSPAVLMPLTARADHSAADLRRNVCRDMIIIDLRMELPLPLLQNRFASEDRHDHRIPMVV